MLGYVTRYEAKQEGYTHVGLLFGVAPIYCYFEDDESPEDTLVYSYRWEPIGWFVEPILIGCYWFFNVFSDEEPELSVRVIGEL